MQTQHLSHLLRLRSELKANMEELKAKAAPFDAYQAFAYRSLFQKCTDLDDAIADLATQALRLMPAEGEC